MNGNSTWAYLILPTLIAGQTLWVGGCRPEQEAIPPGSFRATVEDVVDDDLVLVKQLVITAPGRRSVAVQEQEGMDQVFCDPDRKTGLMTVRVVFVADLIKRQDPEGNILRWMVRIKCEGTTAGGPGLSPAGSAKSLKDLVSLKFDSGVYPLGQDVELGQVQGRKLVLRVE